MLTCTAGQWMIRRSGCWIAQGVTRGLAKGSSRAGSGPMCVTNVLGRGRTTRCCLSVRTGLEGGARSQASGQRPRHPASGRLQGLCQALRAWCRWRAAFARGGPVGRTSGALAIGLVTLTFRSLNSFRLPFVRRPRGFCLLTMNDAVVDYRTH
jgi:hypothetical protein